MDNCTPLQSTALPTELSKDYTANFFFHRPWYIASATPNPKDVVLVIKYNLFETDPAVIDIQFKAVNIILRTLNPKDRVSINLNQHIS